MSGSATSSRATLLLISAPNSHRNGVGDPCWTINLAPHGKRKFTIRARVGGVSSGQHLRNVAVASADSVRSIDRRCSQPGTAPPPQTPTGHCRVTEMPGPAFRC